MNEFKEPAKKMIAWVSAQPVRLICLTIFGCVAVISICSCTAVGCAYEAEKTSARYKYNAETSKEFWKNK